MHWKPASIPPLHLELADALQACIDAKTKPRGALGRLETIAFRLGLMQGTLAPQFHAPTVVVFAGDHGLTAEGVSAFPAAVTLQMVENFLAGGAAINVFARQHALRMFVVDAGVAGTPTAHPALRSLKVRAGTRNALEGPALEPDEVSRCLANGATLASELFGYGCNALLPGEMGIGNTSAAALVLARLLDLPLADCIGRGAGHDEAGLARKAAVLEQVDARHSDARGALEVLGAFGGCEIATMAGAMLEAASRRMLVLVDGFIATAAVAAAADLDRRVLDYCLFAHVSNERGHRLALRALDAHPILDLGLRLGEGSGAALAWPLVVSAAAFLREMATFDSAGVSEEMEAPNALATEEP
jgi:nicotinate-nucleotide--dimethylbenzimidazole phosphoribosyltransferase